ncbi:conjugal transfer protein TraB [Acidithiobacillus sp. CV18-2]|nr:conjugal transfer protein TraB [Acidithiobacillus sp. CV18-3]MBU2755987.1 conjugal transfer protein TraB [Acidithiobacillus sp. BN09-2]MBU2777264.1 conjugal transfer protein TraB [Acidithiobacillus sp. CV18-2]MBU2799886.1 conjugal transfer protein TraB [Acidithiobacillus sp. VAN18-4]
MWPTHWVGPLLSLLFVGMVLLQHSRITRYLVALSYYTAGSVGLLRGVAVFFGAHAFWWEGAFLWLGSAALLSAGWAFADRPWKAVLVLLLDALLLPLGLFDWLSPLSAAGLLFPGTGLTGLLALGLLFLLIDAMWRHPVAARRGYRAWILGGLFAVSLIANEAVGTASEDAPSGWLGIDLQVGPASRSILTNQARHAAIIRDVLALSRNRNIRVVLLPETLETEWAGNVWALQHAIPRGQIWLVGMSIPGAPGLLSDSIVALQAKGKPQTLFNSAFPVPVSMWHPWSRGTGYTVASNVGYTAGWWTAVRNIEGIRTWANICYDQLLPFVWIEGVIQNPQVILLTNNEWWAHGTGIPVIQANTAWVWTRLMGAPSLEAENA